MSDLASACFESRPCRPLRDMLRPLELKMPMQRGWRGHNREEEKKEEGKNCFENKRKRRKRKRKCNQTRNSKQEREGKKEKSREKNKAIITLRSAYMWSEGCEEFIHFYYPWFHFLQTLEGSSHILEEREEVEKKERKGGEWEMSNKNDMMWW